MTSYDNAKWLLDYISQNPGTHSARAMEDVLKALIHAGLTSAAIGVLDPKNGSKLRAVITDQRALDVASRVHWWGESVEDATYKVRMKSKK